MKRLSCLALLLLLAYSSSSSVTPNGACSLNSDCATGLACALGKCRKPCVSATDCGAGGACVDDGRTSACQTPQERNTPCTREADCAAPLACASDYRCRNLCLSDADCNVLGITNRVCARDSTGVDFCADPSEVTGGALSTSPPPGAPSSPVVEPEAGLASSVAMLPDGALIGAGVGSQGGVLGSGEVTVTIPAGALTSQIQLTIEPGGASPAPPAGAVSQVYEIGPTGTLFAQPVTIAFGYSKSQLGGAAPSDFAVETIGQSGQWTPLSQIVVDVQAQTIAGQTSHLSPYVLVQQQGAVATASDASSSATPDAQVAAGDDGGSSGGGHDSSLGMGGDAGGSSSKDATADGAVVEAGAPAADGAMSTDAPSSVDATADAGMEAAAGGDALTPVDAAVADVGSTTDGAAVCPAGPATQAMPNSVAMSSGTTFGGAPFTAVDGYATIVENGPNVDMVYLSQLTLVFSNYPDASGYFVVGANHGNAQTVTATIAPLAGPTLQQYSVQSYSVQSVQLDSYDPGCLSMPAQCQPGVNALLGIMFISSTEIMGTLSVPCTSPGDATADNVMVGFDLPIFTYNNTYPQSPMCCLPLFAP
jgi:hypothetical protein